MTGATQGSTSQNIPISNGDLWAKAYQRMKIEKPRIVEQYEQLFSDGGNAFQGSKEHLEKALIAKVADHDSKQLVLKLGSLELKLRECGERLIKFVIWSRDVVATAVSAEPFAALAMAGVSLLLPLMLEPGKASSALLNGLDHVCYVIRLYAIRQEAYVKSVSSSNQQYEDAVAELYYQILEYQVRALYHLHQNKLKRGFKSLLNPGRWEESLGLVQAAEARCEAYSDILDKDVERHQWQTQSAQMDAVSQTIFDIMKILKENQRAQLKILRDKDTTKMLQAFSTAYQRDKNENRERVPGTCEWLISNPRFSRWRDDNGSGVLLITADPGCGKSVLSRYLIDGGKLTTSPLSTTVCYFFFKAGDESRTRGEHALTAILHQLLEQCAEEDIITTILPKFKSRGTELCKDFSALWEIFVSLSRISTMGHVVCLLDAIDECLEDSREQLTASLSRFLSQVTNDSKISVKFLLTSRPYETVKLSLQALYDAPGFIEIEGNEHSAQIMHEIDLVIEDEIPRMTHNFSEADQRAVVDHLKSIENRTYLYIHLILKVIKDAAAKDPTASRMKTRIKKLPSSVNEAYENVLSRIPPDDIARARNLLSIVLASAKPLSITEVVTILDLTDSEDANSYEDLPELPSEDQSSAMIRELCGLVVSVVDGKVHLLHQTFREYLLLPAKTPRSNFISQRPAQSNDVWQHSFVPSEGHELVLRACLNLMTFQEFRSMKYTDYDRDLRVKSYLREYLKECGHAELPGFRYAATHWAFHYIQASRSFDDGPDPLLSLALAACDTSETNFLAWWSVTCYENKWKCFRDELPLDIACAMGLMSVVKHILGEKQAGQQTHRRSGVPTHRPQLADNSTPSQENATDTSCPTGLSADETNNSEDSGRTPLDIDTENGSKQFRGPTALRSACLGGYEDIVRLLIASGADVHAESRNSNCLSAAVASGNVDLVKYLLRWNIDVNAKIHENSKDTVLIVATQKQQFDVVKLLLDGGAEIDIRNLMQETALARAVGNKDPRMVELLLKYSPDINITYEGTSQSNPMVVATSLKDHTSMELLLKAGARTDLHTKTGRTPLFLAAENGDLEAVNILLRYGADPNLPRTGEDRPIHGALRRDHFHVVNALLQGGADPNRGNGPYVFSGSCLHHAAEHCNIDLMTALIDHKAHLNVTDRTGCTPLDRALNSKIQNEDPVAYQEAVDFLISQGAKCGMNLEQETVARTPD